MKTKYLLRSLRYPLAAGIVVTQLVAAAWAESNPAPGSSEAQRQQVVARGLEYLRAKGQNEDGLFTGKAGPGITALALTSALRNGLTVNDPMVAKGLKALEGFVKPDGGIYDQRLKNYETSVAIVAFRLANSDGKYNKLLADADKFVRAVQYGPGRDTDPSNPWYGGTGYGGDGRPDLSNTSFLLDALVSGDGNANDEAVQRALAFVSRCQNLKGEWNDTKFGPLVNDGGFYYTIPKESDEQKGDRYTENGGLRSYGSMTYAGFKSLLYAGLTESDPRVKAAHEWIKEHYSVSDNPGQGDAGLYYYYHAFAAALAATKLEAIEAGGTSRNWRHDLVAELAKRQSDDGSWVNSNRRWMENDPNLATAFALIALANCEEAAGK
jgi:hypothetical protein